MTATLAQYEVARGMFRGAGCGHVEENRHDEGPASPDPWAALSLTVELPLSWAPLAAENLTRLAIESGADLSGYFDPVAGSARFTLYVFGPADAIPEDCGRCEAERPMEFDS